VVDKREEKGRGLVMEAMIKNGSGKTLLTGPRSGVQGGKKKMDEESNPSEE